MISAAILYCECLLLAMLANLDEHLCKADKTQIPCLLSLISVQGERLELHNKIPSKLNSRIFRANVNGQNEGSRDVSL